MSIEHAELNLYEQGLVLIEGQNNTNDTFSRNGSGKSTLMSAITYALYGISPNGQKADEIINNKVGKNLSVTLEFEKDEIPYRIERYRKHSKYKNTVKFYQEENNLTQKSVADTDKKIQEVFGIDYLTYMNSVMYGQGDVEIFAKASDKGKKQILENLADIEVYRYAQEIAKERAKQAEANKQEMERQIQLKEQEQQFQKQSYDQEVEKYQTTKNKIEEQKEEYRSLCRTKRKKEQELNDTEDEVLPEIEALDEMTDVRSVQVDEGLVNKVQEFQNNITKLQTALNQAKSNLEEDNQTYKKVETETHCYVCGALLDTEHRQKEMQRLTKSIQEKQDYIQKIENALETYNRGYLGSKQELDSQKQQVQEVNNNYQNLVNQRQQYTNQLQQKENELQTIKNQVESSQKILQAYKQVPEPEWDSQKEKSLEKEVQDLNQERNEAKEEQAQYKILAEEVFSNKGIRSDVLDLVTPFLNERANYYLSTLSGSDIEIRFSTQTETAKGELRDKFDLEVINGSGGNTYQSNSAGEKKRIDLAISFAIQDLVQSKANIAVNLSLYDEVFDGLDAIGAENVIKILKERQKEVGSIFVITHSEDLKPLFENVLTIKKDHGVSCIE